VFYKKTNITSKRKLLFYLGLVFSAIKNLYNANNRMSLPFKLTCKSFSRKQYIHANQFAETANQVKEKSEHMYEVVDQWIE